MQLGLGEIEERQLSGWTVHLVEGIGLQIDAVLGNVHFRIGVAGLANFRWVLLKIII